MRTVSRSQVRTKVLKTFLNVQPKNKPTMTLNEYVKRNKVLQLYILDVLVFRNQRDS